MLNVLVVDDSAVMRAMVIKTLRLSGLPLGAVLQAGGGDAALEVLARQRVDLALVDINMPGMTGEELIDRVRADPATAALPIIVVSTESSDVRIAAIRAKGAEFVHKPFTPEQLRRTIVRVAAAPQLPQEESHADATVAGGDCDF